MVSPLALHRPLLRWFDRQKRDLPWRRTADPYAIWLSEVMLQQTQVRTVIPYWERFLARFPTVESLAAAPLPDVLALWSGLGYYSRARNLHRAAQAVATNHAGRFPSTAEALLELPGFGPYTAGAVASIAFGQCTPLVDGNVARVLARLFEMDGAAGDRKRDQLLWKHAATLVHPKRPGDWNQALMELGATVCRLDNPTCLLCPVRADCGAHRSGRVEEIPARRARPARKLLNMAVAVWARDDALLLGRRTDRGLFGGLWELPAADYPASDSHLDAAFTQLLGTDVSVDRGLGTVRRTLTHRELELHLFLLRAPRKAAPRSSSYEALAWVRPDELAKLGLSSAMRAALDVCYQR